MIVTKFKYPSPSHLSESSLQKDTLGRFRHHRLIKIPLCIAVVTGSTLDGWEVSLNSSHPHIDLIQTIIQY